MKRFIPLLLVCASAMTGELNSANAQVVGSHVARRNPSTQIVTTQRPVTRVNPPKKTITPYIAPRQNPPIRFIAKPLPPSPNIRALTKDQIRRGCTLATRSGMQVYARC